VLLSGIDFGLPNKPNTILLGVFATLYCLIKTIKESRNESREDDIIHGPKDLQESEERKDERRRAITMVVMDVEWDNEDSTRRRSPNERGRRTRRRCSIRSLFILRLVAQHVITP
jgi:hypothetical protein